LSDADVAVHQQPPFDRQGRQVSITDSTGTRTTTFTAAGQPDTVAWEDGVLAGMALDYTQDNLLRPAGYTLTRDAQPQPETVTAASYGYDDAGRLHTVHLAGLCRQQGPSGSGLAVVNEALPRREQGCSRHHPWEHRSKMLRPLT